LVQKSAHGAKVLIVSRTEPGESYHSGSERVHGRFADHAPAISPSPTLLPRAIEISLQLRHGVYDCLYIALAEREACKLLTADTKVLLNLRGRFPFIIDLASLP